MSAPQEIKMPLAYALAIVCQRSNIAPDSRKLYGFLFGMVGFRLGRKDRGDCINELLEPCQGARLLF